MMSWSMGHEWHGGKEGGEGVRALITFENFLHALHEVGIELTALDCFCMQFMKY
jgi:hypothetical protein